MTAVRRGAATAEQRAADSALAGRAEELLHKAMAARSAAARARWARQGLATRAPIDKTTQAMLLRQLYLSAYEGRRFQRAREIAMQAIDLGVLVDVLQQDAARAAIGAGDLDAAVAHLRIAARRGPASRRPFHWWTLGSALFLGHRYAQAIAALERAVRWGTRDKPLYRAHLALARIASGERVAGLQDVIDELASAACGQGYGRFVLGHLAYAAGEWAAARRYLEAFVRRVTGEGQAEGAARREGATRRESGRAAARAFAIALEGEVEMARSTIAKMAAN